jgi:electron transport complex protein RnfB
MDQQLIEKQMPFCRKPNAGNAVSPMQTLCGSHAAAAEMNQCPPGDVEGIYKLAELLGMQPKPLNARIVLPTQSCRLD